MFNVNQIVFKDFINTFRDYFIFGDVIFTGFTYDLMEINISVEFDHSTGLYTAHFDTEYDGAIHTTSHMVQAESAKDCIKLIKTTAKEIYKAI